MRCQTRYLVLILAGACEGATSDGPEMRHHQYGNGLAPHTAQNPIEAQFPTREVTVRYGEAALRQDMGVPAHRSDHTVGNPERLVHGQKREKAEIPRAPEALGNL